MTNLAEYNLDKVGSIVKVTKSETGRYVEVSFENGIFTMGFEDNREGEVESYVDFEEGSCKGTPSGVTVVDIDQYTGGVDLFLSNGKKIFVHAEGELDCPKYRYNIRFK